MSVLDDEVLQPLPVRAVPVWQTEEVVSRLGLPVFFALACRACLPSDLAAHLTLAPASCQRKRGQRSSFKYPSETRLVGRRKASRQRPPTVIISCPLASLLALAFPSCSSLIRRHQPAAQL